MQYTIRRTEDIIRTFVLVVEADSIDEAQQIFEEMRYTGEFYDEAIVEHEEVNDAWEEISFKDSETGAPDIVHL